MDIINTDINDIKIIKPKLFEDNRGSFFEAFNRLKLKELGLDIEFVQDNQSLSRHQHTIRGMHYQLNPMAQSKLVRVIHGSIINFVIDIRIGSPTFGQHIKVELSAENKLMLFIPKGFANGLCTLKPDTEIIYKVDNYYSPEHDVSFAYNDPKFNLDWPTDKPLLSERDANAPLYDAVPNNFNYGSDS